MNKKYRLFLCEKLSTLKTMSTALNQQELLNEETDFFIIIPVIAGYKFKYPHKLSFKNSPYFNETPIYKPLYPYYAKYGILFDIYGKEINKDKNIITNNLFKYHQNKIIGSNNNINMEIFLKDNFSDIFYMADNYYTGIRGFELHFKQYYEIKNLNELFNDIKLNFCLIESYQEKSVVNSFNQSKIIDIKNDIFYNKLANTYKNKDYFDYNFNINSILFFNNVIKNIGYHLQDFLITKSMLLTLIVINNNQHSKPEFILDIMEQNNIGSLISRCEILKCLHDYELIKLSNKVELTELSNQFIDNIHTALKSYKINNKFIEIIDKEHNIFKKEVNEFLLNAFKKQKKINKDL